jgi:16S rRNA (cytosine1402-N4)-methyltransferase
MKKVPPQQLLHIPVLLDEVLGFLAPKMGEHYLDLTAGYGGHASKVITAIGSEKLATLVDRDPNAIRFLSEHFPDARIIHADFFGAAKELINNGEKFDMILADFGVSSPQLDQPERGFSFRAEAPLDMRMNPEAGKTAEDIVRHSSLRELAKIIANYGEESPRRAETIAKAIKKARPNTTKELADAVLSVSGHGYHKIHPATRTFQALRIAVNDELGQIENMLPLIPALLNRGGRVALISFHSLEDRLVKNYFREESENGIEAELEVLTKHPVQSLNDYNPRSHSAKLRVARKIK